MISASTSSEVPNSATNASQFSLFYASLLIIAIHLMLEAGHVQMIFYGMLTFALYLLLEFISRLINKREPLKVLRAAGLLVLAGGFAFLMSSDRYLSTLEYSLVTNYILECREVQWVNGRDLIITWDNK